jgi:hypothetical protein
LRRGEKKMEHKELVEGVSKFSMVETIKLDKDDAKLLRWLELYRVAALVVAAAAVRAQHGSLEKVANTLWWVDFHVPPEYILKDGEEIDDVDEEEALRRFVEKHAGDEEPGFVRGCHRQAPAGVVRSVPRFRWPTPASARSSPSISA